VLGTQEGLVSIGASLSKLSLGFGSTYSNSGVVEASFFDAIFKNRDKRRKTLFELEKEVWARIRR